MMKTFVISFLLLISLAGILRAQTSALPPRNQPPPRPNPNVGIAPPTQGQPQMQPPGQGLPPEPGQGIPPVSEELPPNFENMQMTEEPSPLIQPSPEGYTYDPSGRRDPFKPYGQSQQTQAPVVSREDPEKPPVPTDPLQIFDVSQFRLVGIVWQVRSPKAVVRDPVGKMHMIYRDTKIGRNNGFVASIREGEVLVVEPTVGENGMPSAITRSMTLKK